MAKNTRHSHSRLVDHALKAAATIAASPIAKQLAANGFTAATMAQAASDLTDLRSKADAARSAAHQATAALAAREKEIEQMVSSFCNLVRALTTDTAVRKALGVSSPGIAKGPRFRRGPRKKAATTAPATPEPPKPHP